MPKVPGLAVGRSNTRLKAQSQSWAFPAWLLLHAANPILLVLSIGRLRGEPAASLGK